MESPYHAQIWEYPPWTSSSAPNPGLKLAVQPKMIVNLQAAHIKGQLRHSKPALAKTY